jgi:choline monooxygenase
MSSPRPRFDIAPEAAASWTLPGNAYTDPAVFALERLAIQFKSWHYAGNMQDLASPGSYLTARILDQSVIIMRDKDAAIRGFYNVCQHRAHELLEGSGQVSVISCPYHAWSYGTDGRFRSGRGTADMPQARSGAFDLKPVRVEVLAGRFVFFNLDRDPVPLALQAAGLEADLRLELPEFDALVYDGLPVTSVVEANWKVIVDNFLECYHCRSAHPAFAELLDMRSFRVATAAHWMSQKIALGRPDNSAYRVRTDAPQQRGLFWWLWPMTTFNVLPGSPALSTFTFLPLGPARTLQTVQRFVLPGVPVDAARESYQNGVLTDEDIAICESVQRGLSSRGYSAGRFVHDAEGGETSEAAVHLFHRLVAQSLAAP